MKYEMIEIRNMKYEMIEIRRRGIKEKRLKLGPAFLAILNLKLKTFNYKCELISFSI